MQTKCRLNKNLCTCCQCEGFQHDNNLFWIFSCQKEINGVSTVTCSRWHHSHQGRQLTLSTVKTTPLITESALAISDLWYPVLHLQFAKMRAFSLHSLFGFDRYSNLFHFQTNIFNGLVFENATHFAFLPCYLKKHNLFDTDWWMLIKHIYKVGRAANNQSTTDRELQE